MKLLIILMVFTSFSAFSDDFICTKKYLSYVRQEPNSSSQVVAKLKKYTPIKSLKKEGEWFNVKGYNFTGWIHENLITDEYKCMIILKPKYSKCSRKPFKRKQPLTYLEGFQIIKMEIGCNEVKDAWGRKHWISNLNSWPVDGASLKIEI